MERKERLYQREESNSDRWKKSIHALMENKANIDILSKDADHPQNNHPLRIQAKKIMQSLRPNETTNAAKFLLAGIGQAEYIKDIKAAQFLFSNLDFLKMEPDKLKEAFVTAVTDQTPVDNIRAIIETAEIITPTLPNDNTKIAIRIAATTILKNQKNSPNYKELKELLSPPEKKPKNSITTPIFDISMLSEKDKRIINDHNRGISHDEIAKNEGTSRGYIQNRISLLRGKGAQLEKKTHAGFTTEIKKRREIVRDCTLRGMTSREIQRELKKQKIDTTPSQIVTDRANLRKIGQLPPHRT